MKAYGFLRRMMGGILKWAGGIGGGSVSYNYGWPSGGTVETDVKAQWLFDEAASPIVDEVTGISCDVGADGVGYPKYSQVATGSWAGVSPGIDFHFGANSANFFLAGANAQLDINQSNFTWEWIWKQTYSLAINPGFYFDCRQAGGDLQGFYTYTGNSSTGNMIVSIKSTDNTSRTLVATPSPTIDMRDGNLRKFRVVGNRSGNLEIFIDGKSIGTTSLNTLVGKDIKCNNTYIGARYDNNSGTRCGGILYEMRFSNALNNSGGPGGG